MKSVLRAALAAVCLSSLVAGAESGPRILELDARQARALGIVTEPLGAGAEGMALVLPARVVIPPAQTRVVAAPVAGLVERVEVAAQETVRQGQALLTLASPMLLEAQRDYLQAASQARLAEAARQRDQQLFQEGLIAESRWQASEAAHAQAAAQVAERRQLLRIYGMSEAAIAALAAGRGLSPTLTLVAPIGGTVLEQMVTPGQRVEAATPLYRIARLAPLWLEMDVPPADAGQIRPGAAVEAGGARGRVVSVGRALQAASQTVPVRAEMIEDTAFLRPGQFLEAWVAAAGADRAYRVPAAAVMRHQGQAYVFLERKGGYAMVPVRVVQAGPGHARISGDLAAGERVVIKGVAALKAIATGVVEGE